MSQVSQIADFIKEAKTAINKIKPNALPALESAKEEITAFQTLVNRPEVQALAGAFPEAAAALAYAQTHIADALTVVADGETIFNAF